MQTVNMICETITSCVGMIGIFYLVGIVINNMKEKD